MTSFSMGGFHYRDHFGAEPLINSEYQKRGIVVDATGDVLPYPLKTTEMKVRAAFLRGSDGVWYRNSRRTLREPRWQEIAPKYLEVWVPQYILGLAALMSMG